MGFEPTFSFRYALLVRSQRHYTRRTEKGKVRTLQPTGYRHRTSPFKGPCYHLTLQGLHFPGTCAQSQSVRRGSNPHLHVGSVKCTKPVHHVRMCSLSRADFPASRTLPAWQHRDLNSVLSGFNRPHILTCSTAVYAT